MGMIIVFELLVTLPFFINVLVYIALSGKVLLEVVQDPSCFIITSIRALEWPSRTAHYWSLYL